MFYSLPTETKLDIFKFLSYEELCSIKQTNLYLYDFIDKYEGELAREKLDTISIWKTGLEKPIPLYLPVQDSDDKILCLTKVCSGKLRYLQLQLPTIIKSKNDIKIIYYYLNKLFNCCFERCSLREFIFNPEVIELLFGTTKQFYIKKYWLNMDYYLGNKLKFVLNHLIICESLIIDFARNKYKAKHADHLFKILMSGHKFNKACLRPYNSEQLFDHIINYIETSKDCSKMVANIEFYSFDINSTNFIKRAEQIGEEIDNGRYSITKHQISNIYNPKIKFSIFYNKHIREIAITQNYW
ncbi:unnamed protein product [Meloidogyne enterolobii]|uniref:Uncharacterized protein n=1 Tax=Meloidogyne enterolobii TaxID=390850 RepID=A0ACB0YSL3_MELEN